MIAKKLFYGVVFICFLGALFANVCLKDAQHTHTHTGEQNKAYVSTTFLWLKNTLTTILEVWQFNMPLVAEDSQKLHKVRLSPNLSSCHKSMAQSGYQVNCCPPKPKDNEPFIDFKFPVPSSPKRIRRPIHLRDDEYNAKYKRALTIMKSLPYDDPRSFSRQADVHCLYCTGAYNQEYANISIDIHNSWLFFPWHRMFVYFHERILGKLIDDDSFSLSFWQWDSPEGMVTPDIYMKEPFVDRERSSNHIHPNKVADIDYFFVDKNFSSQVQISKNLAFMYNQMVSGAKKVELFMGCEYRPGKGNSCASSGNVEFAPHNTLHLWVGKESNKYREDMGVFYSAGRDPIFWAHHTNMDRIWEVWREFRGHKPEFVDPDWLETSFFFYDENAQLVRIKIRDVLNITMLGYGYQKGDLPWLNARPNPSIDPEIARRALNKRNNGYLGAESSDFRPKGRRLDSGVTVKVFRPTEEKAKEDEVVLVVYGIVVKEDMYVKFDVYVNAIDGNSLGPESREFAGTFVHVPRGVTLILNEGDEKVNIKGTLKLGISELLEDLQASEAEFIWVSLVPRGGSGVSATIDGIRIEYMA